MQQAVKKVLPSLSSHREPTRIIRPRIQPTLHGLTYRDILILNCLPHLNARPTVFLAHHIWKVKIKDHLSLVHTARHDEVRIHYAVVPVDHEVRIDPVIECTITFSDGASLLLRALANDRAPLQTMVLAVFDHVIAVIEHAVEALVQ